MNLHTHQLYLLEQHSESFKILSAIIRINTEGKSLIMKFGPDKKRMCGRSNQSCVGRFKLLYCSINHS